MSNIVFSAGPCLPDGSDWTFALLQDYQQQIERVAGLYQLDTYPNQIEVISAEQMLDAYSSIGMPLGYHHWSFGKKFIQTEQHYKRGAMGLAYEIVINANPCIAYLMEENTLPMQALVIAHACYGHNAFFKNNYLFRTWTDASSIIDYLVFAKNYVSRCEEKYGMSAVEEVLDSCHALMNYGVDRYKRPQKISMEEEQKRQAEREAFLQSQVNTLWRTLPGKQATPMDTAQFPAEPQENILYFIEKHAPLLQPWQRELVRIVRKIAQYFYPQRQTQVMNEGWATFWHYSLLQHLHSEGRVSDRFMLEILHHHTNVVRQPEYHSPFYSGINPYALGFAMFADIKRICQQPTAEDKHWFPDLAGSDWLPSVHFAMQNFKDESFISQYLSPKVIRDFRLFAITDDHRLEQLQVSAIHNSDGYHHIRQLLSAQYNLSHREPNIQVQQVNINSDRALTLRYIPYNAIPLGGDLPQMMRHLHRLWGFNVRMEQQAPDGTITLLQQSP